jgi:hypothetical protein
MKWLAVVTLLLSACVSNPAASISTREAVAVRVAEAFIERNGYTVAGHPPGLPVLRVEIFDVLASDEELIKQRRGELEPHAMGVENKGHGAYWVYFPTVGDPNRPRIVFVKDGEAQQVFHQSYGLPGPKMKRLPFPASPP